MKDAEPSQRDKLDQLIASALQTGHGERLLESGKAAVHSHAESVVGEIPYFD
jgi:hypothetical protein